MLVLKGRNCAHNEPYNAEMHKVATLTSIPGIAASSDPQDSSVAPVVSTSSTSKTLLLRSRCGWSMPYWERLCGLVGSGLRSYSF